MEIPNIKIDKYGSMTMAPIPKKRPFSFVYPGNDIPTDTDFGNKSKSKYLMKNYYFIYNCKRNADGNRDLTLDGKDLYKRIGRRCEDWDIPYLTLFLSKNHDVLRIRLPNNNITSTGFINLIDCVIAQNHIIELDVRGNRVDHTGINYMCHFGAKIQLQALKLSANDFEYKDSMKIALMIANNTFIRHLEVAQVGQTETSLAYFTTVLRPNLEAFNKTLKILDLSRPVPQSRMNKFDSSHIATTLGVMLQFNATLEEIHLQKFDFICHDIEEMLENAIHNKTLKVLDLSCNNIGDLGAERLGQWLSMRPNLRSLSLGHNIVTDNGLRLLSKGVRVSKLTALDVSCNRFTDQSALILLRSIIKSPLVRQLGMSGNKLGHPTAKLLQRMLASTTLVQENIDVKPYVVDGIYYIAYYHRKQVKENLVYDDKTCKLID